MNDDFLKYLRETNPSLANATDDNLRAYITENRPDLIQYLSAKPSAPPQQTTGEQFQKNLASPFFRLAERTGVSNIRPMGPTGPSIGQAARLLDVPMSAPMGVAQGVANIKEAFNAPDAGTGILEGLYGAAQAGLGGAGIFVPGAAAAMNAFGGTVQGLREMSPGTGEAIDAVSNPFQSVIQPTSRAGKAAAGLADIGTQVLGYGMAAKGARRYAPEAVKARGFEKGVKDFRKAAPPTAKELNLNESLKRAAPYLGEQERLNPISKTSDVSPVRQAYEAIAEAKRSVWEKAESAVNRHPEALVDGSEISRSIRENISDYVRKHEPQTAAKIEAYAETFNRPIPIQEAWQFISELNARTQRYQKGTPEVQAQLATAFPNVASEVAAVDALRGSVFSRLAQYGERDVAELRKDYGALSAVQKATERNIVKAERDPRYSGYGSSAAGAGRMAETQFLIGSSNPKAVLFGGIVGLLRDVVTKRNEPNPAMARAMRSFGKYADQPRQVFPPTTNIAGLLPPGQINLGSGPDISGVHSVPATPADMSYSGTPKLLPESRNLMGRGEPPPPEVRTGAFARGGIDPASINPGDIPVQFRMGIEKILGSETITRLGKVKELSDADLVRILQERGLDHPAPKSEAPVSRGGDMSVRGPANQAQIERLTDPVRYDKTPAGEQGNMFAGRNDPAYQAKQPTAVRPRESVGASGTPLFSKEPQFVQQEGISTPRAIGIDAVRRHPDLFPAMSRVGKITPSWVIDAKTGAVKLADEFLVFDRSHLNLKRPSTEMVKAKGGRLEGNGDLAAQAAGFEDFETFRNAYEGEYALFNKMRNDPTMAAEQYGVVRDKPKAKPQSSSDMNVPFQWIIPILAQQMLSDRR